MSHEIISIRLDSKDTMIKLERSVSGPPQLQATGCRLESFVSSGRLEI